MKYKNFSKGVLTNELLEAGTSLTITTTETFPTTGQFKAVIWDSGETEPQNDSTREIMTLEWNSGNSEYDIVGRGQEDTAAKTWASGSNIAHIVTAGQFDTYEAKQDALGYTPEDQANKKTTLTDSDIDYPTTKAVNTGLAGKEDTIDYTPEDQANKTPSFQATPDDTKYPTEKLVKDSLDEKAELDSATVEITVANWDSGTTVDKTVTGITATSIVWVSPVPASYDKFVEFGIRATAQTTDQITFEADATPDETINLNVVFEI